MCTLLGSVDAFRTAEHEVRAPPREGGRCQVVVDLCDERLERSAEVVKEREDLRGGEHSLGHDEAPEVGAEV
jgi:hypothetical protein